MYLVATTMTTAPLLSCLFFISFYSTASFNYAVIVSGHCLSDQQSLLLQFRDTLIFNETRSKILVKWNQSSDCCSWEGITCDEEGRVTGLKLSMESISGGIDDKSTLFNLKYLKSLDLSLNWHLNSTIPSRIGNLTNLSYLNFSASFSGEIPDEMSRLMNLHILDFSKWPREFYSIDVLFTWSESLFRNLQFRNFSMVVHNLNQLEELYLDGVYISEQGGNKWGQALSSSLPNLRVLSLVDCSLSGPIPGSLATIQHLSVIKFDYNDLSSPVPGFLGNFSNLTFLQLRGCGLHGTFPREIFQVPSLRFLDIAGNEFLEAEFPGNSSLQSLNAAGTNLGGRLPSSIGNLRQLRRLDLSDCHFSGSIPKSIANLTQLVYLDLSFNQFVGPIPSFNVSNNYQLRVIDLSHNLLSGPIPSFSESRSLTTIYLSQNQLSGPIPPAYFEGLPNLIDIDLGNNYFQGNVPSSLFALPLLRRIDLSYNQFSGQLPEFPYASSSNLYFIDLRNNKLESPIPMSIFKLRELDILSLSSNMFNGTIQLDFFEDLSTLVSLDLSYNNLSVSVSGNGSYISFLPYLSEVRLASCNLQTFPELFKIQMLKLESLDLSDNRIHGEIPNWIWKLGNGSLYDLNLSHNHLVGIQEPYSFYNINTLDLSFNQIHGKIPMLPPQIYYVDLSSNSFTSTIPSDIGKSLKRTFYFSLANNSIVGVIPESICYAKDLSVLDLSHNCLNGRIPACLLARNETGEVNLRRNNLSGPIPDAFPVNCNLKTLDLGGNLLSSRFPKSLANCSVLEYLDLGRNRMVGTFPALLKNISTLRVLILRSNKFYGHLTCAESIGFWPMIQVVDVASNNFSGLLPASCLTKWHAMMMGKAYNQSYPIYDASAPGSEDAVTIINKGLEREMSKITSNGFTSIDFSSNTFHGGIPEELGKLLSLIALNLSNNDLGGQIPSSLGDLRQLESLDLSRNHLSGTIPASLSNLHFLGYLNFSCNQLHGRIPPGQIQNFLNESFQGNQGLCGLPLTQNCQGDVPAGMRPGTPNEANRSISGNNRIEWRLLSVEIGFIVGFGTVIGPLLFWQRWRKWYFDRVEEMAYRILPHTLLRRWLTWKMGTTRRVRVSGRRGN